MRRYKGKNGRHCDRCALLALLFAMSQLPATGASWRSVAIGGGGFVTGLTASTDGSAVYLRTDVGGAYRRDEPNSQWLPITDSLPNDANNNGSLYGVGAIAVDPSNANRVFLACGKYNWSNPSGVYYCDDTRVENPVWTVIDPDVKVCGNSSFRSSGERLAVDPYNPDVVYFGTYNIGGISGLRKYVRDGTWSTTTLATPVTGEVDYGISFVAPDPGGGSVSDGERTVCKRICIGIYGATGGGVFVSEDAGASWTKITGLEFNKPFRGEIGPDGMLYVTGVGNVAKVARGETSFTSVAPAAGLNYTGLAVDPNSAGTVMVAEVLGNERIWRSTDGGSSWIVVNRKAHATEPDGTRSVTSGGKLNNIADILITPGNPAEVWASDFSGVQRTQNIRNDASASDWYTLQKNQEELVALMLRSAPAGAPLLSAVADCNGYVHDDPSVRPQSRFNIPPYLSTTAIDFSEGSDGKVWARVGNLYYWQGSDADRMGGTSIDGGRHWGSFGQLHARPVTNSPAAGWEQFDVEHYVRNIKNSGASAVTLVLRAGAWQQNQHALKFSSKEGANPPQLVINGNTVLIPAADAMVHANTKDRNYGSSTELIAQNYYEQDYFNRWIYLKFDLGSVGDISSAVLRLHRLANASDTTAFSAAVHASSVIDWAEVGLTWANRPAVYEPPGGQGGRIALSATDPANLVWVQESGAVWYSRDRGVTWMRALRNGSALTADGMSQFTTSRNPLAADRVAANTFYLYVKAGNGTVLRSVDGGAAWSTLTTNIGTPESYKLHTVPGQEGRFWYVAHNWNSPAGFKYWTGEAMVNTAGISDVVDFAFGKAAPGRTNPVVYARRSNGTYWMSPDATSGTTSTWTALDVPAMNAQPTVMEACRQRYGRLYVGTGGRGLFYTDVVPDPDDPPNPDDPPAIGTVTWTGAGSGTNWNESANWDDRIPGPEDTALFTNTGLAMNRVVALGANQTVAKLVIAATIPFTIGNADDVTAGYSLAFTDFDRQDVEGTEGRHTFAAPVNLVPDSEGNSTWTINGSDLVRMNAVLGSVATTTFVKMGSGTFNMNYASPSYSGPWRIVEGTVTAGVAVAMKGNPTIGGTDVPARLTQSVKNALFNNMNVTVLTNGTFTAGDIDNGRVDVIHVKEGGVATIGYYFYSLKARMTGGTINGGSFYNGGWGQEIYSYSSDIPALFNCEFRFAGGWYDATIAVQDGSPPVDLTITGALVNGAPDKVITKTGAGTVRLLSGGNLNFSAFRISGGTLLVDNASGSVNGRSPVAVNGGAILGGTGFIGGVESCSNANVVASSSSAGSPAVIAPGTIDEVTGDHIFGTLTVGSEVQTNNVTFGSNSLLRMGIGTEGAADRLEVYGSVDLSSASDALTLTVNDDARAGVYTLVSASEGITGVFNTIDVPNPLLLTQTATTIEYIVPAAATLFVIR